MATMSRGKFREKLKVGEGSCVERNTVDDGADVGWELVHTVLVEHVVVPDFEIVGPRHCGYPRNFLVGLVVDLRYYVLVALRSRTLIQININLDYARTPWFLRVLNELLHVYHFCYP